MKTNRHQAKLLVTSQHPENTKKIPQSSRNSKNNIPYKELGMRMVSVLSIATTLEHRRQIVKEKDSQLRILYTAKLSIKCEGKIKTFSHIKCLKILTSRVPFSQESLRMTNPLQWIHSCVAIIPLFFVLHLQKYRFFVNLVEF